MLELTRSSLQLVAHQSYLQKWSQRPSGPSLEQSTKMEETLLFTMSCSILDSSTTSF